MYSCFGKPITPNGRAENECWECEFEHECEAKRKEATYCNANEAARLVKKYYEELYRRTEEVFPIMMQKISKSIRNLAKCGLGRCVLSINDLSKDYDGISVIKLQEMIVKELTENLGYRVVEYGGTLEIVWASDI